MKYNFDWRNVDINFSFRICCVGLVELKFLVEKIEMGFCFIIYWIIL